MNLIQFLNDLGETQIGLVNKEKVIPLANNTSFYNLALKAANEGLSIREIIKEAGFNAEISLSDLLNNKKLLLPIDRTRTLITGVGLTHYRSVLMRDALKCNNQPAEAQKIYTLALSDKNSNMFSTNARPEWFFKGFGCQLRSTQQVLEVPSFAKGVGEEAELAAIYIINSQGIPFRLGFSLGNEFSDHLLEKESSYYLAQSKLMPCSIGPEIYIGEIPPIISGEVSIKLNGKTIWEKEFRTGQKEMVHSLSNIEYHVFKHTQFCQPESMHVLYLGADQVSFLDNVQLLGGEEIRIKADLFNIDLVNTVETESVSEMISIKALSD